MTVTIEQLQAQLSALLADNAALKAKAARPAGRLSCKVSLKGAVSIYGLGRWPVTLYAQQMERLLGAADEIRAFMADNADKLSVKGEGDVSTAIPATTEASTSLAVRQTSTIRR
jgi:hypothetical protein